MQCVRKSGTLLAASVWIRQFMNQLFLSAKAVKSLICAMIAMNNGGLLLLGQIQ